MSPRTLREIARAIDAEYGEAEALQPWLSERPGVQLKLWRDPTNAKIDGDRGGWRCALLRGPGGVSISTLTHDYIEGAIEHACRAFELTEKHPPPTEPGR